MSTQSELDRRRRELKLRLLGVVLARKLMSISDFSMCPAFVPEE